MLKELKFVQGAVSKKDFIPAMSHFMIHEGEVRSFNGMLALSSPIQCDLNCKPKGIPMVQAIGRCTETVQLSMTPTGRLAIRSGSFKAFIECISEETPHVEPEGDRVDFNGEAMLAALKSVQPFIGNDASRPWTNGALLRGQSVYATNNVCLVEHWVGVDFPHVVNIPRQAVAEMVRINEPPTHAQISQNSMTLHYADGRWIRTQLFDTGWPDLQKVLDRESNAQELPEKLFEGLAFIKPFADKLGRVYINGSVLSTHEGTDEGASFDIGVELPHSIFNIEMLAILEGVAKSLDLGAHPEPGLFFGDNLRGAIVGLRL